VCEADHAADVAGEPFLVDWHGSLCRSRAIVKSSVSPTTKLDIDGLSSCQSYKSPPTSPSPADRQRAAGSNPGN